MKTLNEDGVTFRLDPQALVVMASYPDLQPFVAPAGPDDFDTEWLSLVLGIKVVAGLKRRWTISRRTAPAIPMAF